MKNSQRIKNTSYSILMNEGISYP